METFVGDTITLNVNSGIDLSGYADLFIKFRRPNKSIGHWSAILDPLDNNRMYYVTLPTDLNMPGTWIFQAHAEDPGVHLHGLWTEVEVHTPLAETSTPPTTLAPTSLAPTTI